MYVDGRHAYGAHLVLLRFGNSGGISACKYVERNGFMGEVCVSQWAVAGVAVVCALLGCAVVTKTVFNRLILLVNPKGECRYFGISAVLC